MNYLDILPNDVMKIINRKVQDAQIIKEEQKEKKIKEYRERKNKQQITKKGYTQNLYIYIKNIYFQKSLKK